MSRIIQLDQQTANSIAAGEVVERPSSVVKELVENALDAGSSVVSIEISQGGIGLIRVTDNGSGMDAEDALLAFGRHATSKLRQIEDLDTLVTMGFRGEALASIAAVSRVILETREAGSDSGTRIVIEGGVLKDQTAAGCPEGTRITVEDLFYNVPARFKFLRKDSTEAGHVAELVERMALARPDVSFRLVSNQQAVLHTPGNNDLTSAVYAVFGRQTAQACLPVEAVSGPLHLTGLVSRPELARSNRGQQCFFVNGRLIRSKAISAALDEACKTRLMKGKYAVAVLFLTVPTQLVDINVHPQKLEVRFWNDNEVFRCVYHAVLSALQEGAGIAAEPEKENGTAPEQEQAQSSQAEPDGPAVLPDHSTIASPEQQDEWQQTALLLQDQPIGSDRQQPAHRMVEARSDPEPSADPARSGGPADLLGVQKLTDARLIGTLFRTYVLLETGDDLLLVDQHAAHEKILFERLVRRHRTARETGSMMIQDLLVPVVVEVSRRDLQTLQADEGLLRRMGFDCSQMGATSIAVRSIPDTGQRQLQPEPALRLALNALQQNQLQADDDIEEVYYQMACKAAVKAHDRLDEVEIRQLLLDLQELENPYQCPHGRPVMVRLPRRELEKRFRRIV